jgi:hypothetical protein
MIVFGSYCCSAVEIPSGSGNTSSTCFLASPKRRFFGLGTGVMNADLRRDSVMILVG